MFFSQVEHITIDIASIEDPPNHFLELNECVTATVANTTIRAPYLSPNSDGLNFYGGFDGTMRDMVVDNGDDCVR